MLIPRLEIPDVVLVKQITVKYLQPGYAIRLTVVIEQSGLFSTFKRYVGQMYPLSEGCP